MIYSNFRIFFNPPNGLRHRPYSKRPLHSHKLVSIPNRVLVPGSNLTLYNYFFWNFVRSWRSRFETYSLHFFFKLMIQWTEWMMNFGWQLRGVFVKTNLQSNTKLVRKNLFSEIKQKLIFSYQLFKEVQNHFYSFFHSRVW